MVDRAAQAGMELITLPHHVEYLSDRWFDEVRRFWRDLPAPRKAAVAGRGSSLEQCAVK